MPIIRNVISHKNIWLAGLFFTTFFSMCMGNFTEESTYYQYTGSFFGGSNPITKTKESFSNANITVAIITTTAFANQNLFNGVTKNLTEKIANKFADPAYEEKRQWRKEQRNESALETSFAFSRKNIQQINYILDTPSAPDATAAIKAFLELPKNSNSISFVVVVSDCAEPIWKALKNNTQSSSGTHLIFLDPVVTQEMHDAENQGLALFAPNGVYNFYTKAYTSSLRKIHPNYDNKNRITVKNILVTENNNEKQDLLNLKYQTTRLIIENLASFTKFECNAWPDLGLTITIDKKGGLYKIVTSKVVPRGSFEKKEGKIIFYGETKNLLGHLKTEWADLPEDISSQLEKALDNEFVKIDSKDLEEAPEINIKKIEKIKEEPIIKEEKPKKKFKTEAQTEAQKKFAKEITEAIKAKRGKVETVLKTLSGFKKSQNIKQKFVKPEKFYLPIISKEKISQLTLKKQLDRAIRLTTIEDPWETPEKDQPVISKAQARILRVNANDEVCFMGDIHGSINALIQNFEELIELGYLDDRLAITKKNFYMVFLGDYVDRPNDGVPVLSLLMRLQEENPEKVFLLAGNHDIDKRLHKDHGFTKELIHRYGKNEDTKTLHDKIIQWGLSLPVALFIVAEQGVIHCSHGGFDPKFDVTKAIASKAGRGGIVDIKTFRFIEEKKPPVKLDEDLVKVAESHKEDLRFWFTWSDYNGTMSSFVPERSGRPSIGTQMTEEYMKNMNIVYMIRGHEHGEAGFKLTPRDESAAIDYRTVLANKNITLPPRSRDKYIRSDLQFSDLQFKDIGRVLTFSTATGLFHATVTRMCYDNCFGILKFQSKNNWKDPNNWQLSIYEKQMGPDTRKPGFNFKTHPDVISYDILDNPNLDNPNDD